MPLGFQITQKFHPIAKGGFLQLSNGEQLEIEQIQLEQDTASIQYNSNFEIQNIDYNRAGIGLLEIVTKPHLSNSKQGNFEFHS